MTDQIFLQADSSQAEGRVVALLANDLTMLKLYDTNDVHALTASWFFGGTESDYSKKVLGYEVPTRFIGKTLRHAGHLGAKGRRASIEVNTSARKYKINTRINEAQANLFLTIFHRLSPNVQGVFHKEVIEALSNDRRRLRGPVPYGVKATLGGIRTFFERWGDELFRQAFSYIPQRAVSDNTKAAALRIRERIPGIRIACESHDSLLFPIRKDKVEEYAPIIKAEMEREIDFTNCSLSRGKLSIPCDIELGENYQDFKKYRI